MFNFPDSRMVRQANSFIRVGPQGAARRPMRSLHTASGFSTDQYNPASDRLEQGGVIEDWIPTDPAGLHKLFRMIYLRDGIAGPAVDLYRELPWSEYTVTGKDPAATRIFEEAIEHLNIPTLMTDITGEFLVMGKVIGSSTWDDGVGRWMDCIIHDPDFCRVTPRPIRNYPPKVDLQATPAWKQFIGSKDPRDVEIREELDPDLIQQMRSADYIPLATDNTIYFPRRAAPYDEVGTTFFTRLLSIYGFEKQLMNATLTGVKRKANGTVHIQAGTENWEPDENEMNSLVGMFLSAEQDPVGAIVVTRTGVEVTRLDGNQGMWKISDEWSFLKEAKMNALGINDALLSGDQTLSTKEAALSIFIDRLRAMRLYATREIIINKFLAPVAKVHEIYETAPKEIEHRYRMQDRKLALPEIAWKKQLQPIADEDYLSILTTLKEEGIPIPLRVWAAAGGYDIDKAMKLFETDKTDRESVKKWKEDTGQGGDEGAFGSANNFTAAAMEAPEFMVRRAAAESVDLFDSLWSSPDSYFVSPTLTKDRVKTVMSSFDRIMGADKRSESFARKWLTQVYNQHDSDLILYLMARMNVLPPYKIRMATVNEIAKHLAKCTAGFGGMIQELWLLHKWYCDRIPNVVADVFTSTPVTDTKYPLKAHEFLTGSTGVSTLEV